MPALRIYRLLPALALLAPSVAHALPFGSPAWTWGSGQQLGLGGKSMAAGDFDGDGFSDVLVGAPSVDSTGAGYCFPGSPSGPALLPTWTVELPEPVANLGISASAGDVNGDGFSDVALGASFYGDSGGIAVYLGSPVGLGASAQIVEGGGPFAYFGNTVAAGDVDGDGLEDVAVGAIAEAPGGHAYLFRGDPSGIESTAAWTAAGSQSGEYYSYALATGDVDGDGYAELVVGAPNHDGALVNQGSAFVYRGSSLGLDAVATWDVEGTSSGEGFGTSATLGDFDGDGFDDLAVGSPSWSDPAPQGRASVFYGSAAGPGAVAGWTGTVDHDFVAFGGAVGAAGDLDGDGFAELAVGAPSYADPQAEEGASFLFFGSSQGPSVVADAIGQSDNVEASFGASVGTAGDVDGDGLDDLRVGAPRYSSAAAWEEGRAYVFLGGCTGGSDADVDAVPDTCDACPGFDDRLDEDGDGVPDACDGCPTAADPDQVDADGDAVTGLCDCDDSDPNAFPGAIETCDGRDDDCDGQIDAPPPPGADTWYADADGDGHGDPATPVTGCSQPTNTAVDADDCDDTDPAVHVDAPEACDGRDTNCDGIADDPGVCADDARSPQVSRGCGCDDSTGGSGWLVVLVAGLLRRRPAGRQLPGGALSLPPA